MSNSETEKSTVSAPTEGLLHLPIAGEDDDLPKPPQLCCNCYMKTFTKLELWLIWVFSLPLIPLMLFFTLIITMQPEDYSIFTRSSYFLGCLLSAAFAAFLIIVFAEKEFIYL